MEKTRHNSNIVRREERKISPPSGDASDDELTSMKGEGILFDQIIELALYGLGHIRIQLW